MRLLLLVALLLAGCASEPEPSSTPDAPSTPEAPEAPAASAAPAAPDAPDPEHSVLGSWRCTGDSDPEVTFAMEEGERVFRSFLNERPASVGTYRYEGGALVIEGTGGEHRFTTIARTDSGLILQGGGEAWYCTSIPDGE